jgi:large subunit ribosomal protein L15
MITINTLPKVTKNKNKRIGRGHGSGRVKTGGKGTKGQKARQTIPLMKGIAGISFVKRLPLYRGKYRNKPGRHNTYIVNIKDLNILPKNTIVDREVLISKKIIDKNIVKDYKIKLLGDGELNTPLTVKLPCSKGAKKKIEKAGGKIEI